MIATRRGDRQPIRRPLDDFDLGVDAAGGSRHSDEAVEAGQKITLLFGPPSAAAAKYEQLLGYAPPDDLRKLRARGAVIVMAPTVPAWLCSRAADRRRGRRLSDEEQSTIQRGYGPQAGTVATYDPETDSLILPTDHVSPDPLQPVLHELGHALTLERAWCDFRGYSHLLDELPRRIQMHLKHGYPVGDDDESVRVRVAEMFAEAYAMVIGGRDDELTPALASALVGILADMGQQKSSLGSIDPATGRTATYVAPETMVREPRAGDVDSTELPALSRAGDRSLLERRARPWPPESR